MSIEINSRKDGQNKNIEVISISGRVDSMSAYAVGEILNDRIDKDVLCIVLNLWQAEYISSATLREMLAALRRIHHRGGNIILSLDPNADRDGQPSTVIELAGLDQIFKLTNSDEEAITYLESTFVKQLPTD